MVEKVILLVEDNPADIALTQRAIKRANISNEMKVVHDGIEALDYLFGTGEYAGRDVKNLPAVVLLDLKLPKIDGIEVLRRIRANPVTKNVPIVVLTSSKELVDIKACYELHCNSYVRKPVDFNQFAEAVKELGLYWLGLNELPPEETNFRLKTQGEGKEVKGVILLVDDNQADIVLTTKELKDISVNTRVVAVHGGQEALDYLFGEGAYAGRDVNEIPVLIILDLRMPGLDGLDVLKKIRESAVTTKLPVMLFTMDDFDTERIRSQTPGCAYVHKPLDFKQFSAAAEELGLSWLIRRDSLAAKT